MYPAALRNGVFARLFYAFVLTNAASMMTFVVLPLVAYERSGSGAAFALVMLGGSIGRLVAMPVGGVLADRFDRRRIMLAGDALLLGVLGLIYTAVTFEAWTVLAVAQLVQNLVGSLVSRAGPALRRDVVSDEHRVQSISLLQMVTSMSLLVGPLLGAALYSVVGFDIVIAIEVAALVTSYVLLAGLRHDATRVRRDDLADRAVTGNVLIHAVRETGRDLRDAARATRRDRYLVWSLAGAPASGAGNGLFIVAFVPWLVESLHAPSAMAGPFLSTIGGSAVLGGLVLVKLGERVRPAHLLRISVIGTALMPMLFVATPHLFLVFVAAAVMGLSEAGWGVASSTVEQRRVPSRLQGRIPALWQTAFLVANVASIAIAGFTVSHFDPRWTIAGSAACWFLLLPLGLLAARHIDTPAPLIADEQSTPTATATDATTTDANLAVSG